MPAEQTTPPETEPEVDVLLDWRMGRLVELGFTPRDALRLASLPYVDTHQAAKLIGAGCAHRLAIRILR